MEGFCVETNKLFAAMNNIQFHMPVGYAGIEPSMRIENGRMIFDFGDALIFTLNNVVWDNGGGSVYVSGGQLHIAPTST
jgi:hypothetical protein